MLVYQRVHCTWGLPKFYGDQSDQSTDKWCLNCAANLTAVCGSKKSGQVAAIFWAMGCGGSIAKVAPELDLSFSVLQKNLAICETVCELERAPVKIVDLPIENGDFHSYVSLPEGKIWGMGAWGTLGTTNKMKNLLKSRNRFRQRGMQLQINQSRNQLIRLYKSRIKSWQDYSKMNIDSHFQSNLFRVFWEDDLPSSLLDFPGVRTGLGSSSFEIGCATRNRDILWMVAKSSTKRMVDPPK